jgi:peroxiredoxin
VNHETPASRNQPDITGETTAAQTGSSFAGRLKRKLSRREYRVLCAFAVVVLPLAIFWKPIQQQSKIYFLLRADAPSPEVLSDVARQTGNPKSLLLRLWHTQRIPDRHFVLSYLGRIADSQPELFHAMESVLVDATADADITTRELAFAVLTRTKHPRLHQLALKQLADADPAARVLGLQSLRSIATSNDVPAAMQLLDDSDPRVVMAAALVLRQATGLDFGLKSSSLASPRFTSIDNTNSPQADWQTNAIAQGVQRWRDWWKEHQAGYPASLAPPPAPIQPARLTTSDFSLNDSDGKAARLSDFRGKNVLLAFWSLDAPVSLDDAPALNALQRRNPGSVAVLGIMVPPGPDDNMPGMKMPAQPDAAQTSALVRETARLRQINFPMLIDAKGEISSRFAVEEDLPVYVLVDAQGKICRQFVGNRTRKVFEVMVEEATNTNLAQAQSK